MRPPEALMTATTSRFPRVSGDAPQFGDLFVTMTVFSPRERGCAPPAALTLSCRRVFPA